MKLHESARRAAARLTEGGVPDAVFEAEMLARAAGGVTRAQYYAGVGTDAATIWRLDCLIARRLRREPSAYILGTREFFGLDFEVTPAVLIPRPETELLVEIGLAELSHQPQGIVLDVGTGTGCIAVSVAASAPQVTVLATDVSTAALAVARRNAAKHSARVMFARGHLATSIARADVVLANLPYIPSPVIDTLESEVRDWEPRCALDGGPDGLALVRQLISDCGSRLRPALLAMEVQYDQAATVAALASEHGAVVEVVKDYAGIDRVVCARWR